MNSEESAPQKNWPSLDERFERGKVLREKVARAIHGVWTPAKSRPDPVAVLEQSNQDRLPDLVPLRYARMLASPFAFFRGAAAIMAADLSTTPKSTLRVQCCGDCHLANFGTFGTPERSLIFDITDLDETLPAPWEWDVKRLAASFAIAGRQLELTARGQKETAAAVTRAYRERIREIAAMHYLEAWYLKMDVSALMTYAKNEKQSGWAADLDEGARHTGAQLFAKLTEVVKNTRRIKDYPPLVFHPTKSRGFETGVRKFFDEYRTTLPDDRRVLLDRYKITDIAMKVVGVGSVGLRCAIALLMAGDDDSLFLQFKEARPSVLEPYAGRSVYKNSGQRVVCGQRLMQAASDMFLGWASAGRARSFYFRQLRDMKSSVDISKMSAASLLEYAKFCGWALARSHARSGDSAAIAGYMGKSDAFDRAIGEFSVAYADQNDKDYAALRRAVKTGKVAASGEIPVVQGSFF